ncbi:MAG: hypothetical protein V3U80_01465 [Flavobacteriaceae bacterium]
MMTKPTLILDKKQWNKNSYTLYSKAKNHHLELHFGCLIELEITAIANKKLWK